MATGGGCDGYLMIVQTDREIFHDLALTETCAIGIDTRDGGWRWWDSYFYRVYMHRYAIPPPDLGLDGRGNAGERGSR